MEQEKAAVTVELVDVTYKAPKELNEVRVALTKILEKAKGGEPLAQIVFEELEDLQKAVQGVAKIPDEFKQKLRESVECAGHMGGALAGVLLTPTAAPAA